ENIEAERWDESMLSRRMAISTNDYPGSGFEKAAGLKVNLNKSRVYGIGMNRDAVEDMARRTRCSEVNAQTGGQTGRGGGRTREQTGQGGGRDNGMNRGVVEVPDFPIVVAQQLQDLLPTIVAQVGDHISNQGINESRNDNVTYDSIHEDDRNVNVSNGRSGCSYKKFMACKPKEFDEGQARGREAAIGITWEDFKSLMKEDYCPSNEMQKLETGFWNHVMVGAGHAAYTDRFHKLARLVPHLVTLKTKRIERHIYGLTLEIHGMVAATEPPTIQNVILKAGVLTDEVVRGGSLRKSGARRGDGGEPSKEGNFKVDNKRTRNGKVFATITNPVKKEYTGLGPKYTNCPLYHYLETPCRKCTNYNRLGYFAKDCRAGPKMVTPLNTQNSIAARRACYECGGTDHHKSACPRLNRAPGQRGNRLNQALTIEGGQGRGNNGNPTHGRAFVMGSEEPC
ncbi:reverse transcriptase domain-containing protein, partial [Tanacetum coccineum]